MTSIIMARKVTCAYILLFCINGSLANWNDWWTYEGISGPDFWGRLNPGLWGLCSTGRRQSPINIEPQRLLFDPQLQGLQVGKARVRGVLRNTGQGVVFRVETPGTLATDSLGLQSDTSGHMAEHGIGSAPRIELPSVNISGGPLSYSYRVYEIQLHFGRTDHQGSEHLLAGFAFPAEVQIYAYNSVLYANSSEARNRAYGIAAVSIFVKVTRKDAQTRGNGQDGFLKESKMTKPNLDLKMLTDQLQYITYKGDSVPLKALSIYELLPATAALITYEGSLTTPGCEETATWIVLNRPLYMSPSQLAALRKLKQGEPASPIAPLGNNFRFPQPLHQRAIRTNIDLVHPDRGRETATPTAASTNSGEEGESEDAFSNAMSSHCPKKFYQVSPEHLAVNANFLDSR
ncbi:carbonic anhydrase-related protein 10-like isoform X2 [Varroa destructor]|uniref:Alpha-carbonic anhydrase domain-containing protein n=1 Tax=Varroa destructor TaxID=109461 RepID=A0A7M7K2M2_VARDE|nr:carbonic anhydrase-related protein 10-like isoform X2 [Varroa destructor]